ncbi:hypothetical protein [Clostridium massiliamazoniense]|uniref:hypothetical protein n=1 Tax=Clostridium massiliamazoniense TaxID=1347366 RepID=UPI0006D79CB8|nr:hypothetical protein [Clostridium massiliamazoniense]
MDKRGVLKNKGREIYMWRIVFFLIGSLTIISYCLVDKEYKSIVLIAFIFVVLSRILFDYLKKVVSKKGDVSNYRYIITAFYLAI